MALLDVNHDVREAAVVVSANGEIDSGTVDVLIAGLESALEAAAAHPTRILIVELAEVTYFGSAGLNAILGCFEKGRADGVSVRIVASNAQVMMPIQVTKLVDVLKPFPTVAEALTGTDGTQ